MRGMIDRQKVRSFWDARAASYKTLPFESVANLEQDAGNLELKIRLETEKIFDWLGDLEGLNVLDLGAGVGQWTFRFSERGAAAVTAVEYSKPLVEIGRREAFQRGAQGVKFVASPAEKYVPRRKFDIVFISGLFVYLTDEQAAELMTHLPEACRPETRVLVRDGTGISKRHEIDDQHSKHLQTLYSATYRTRDEYRRLFAEAGFRLPRDENMFPEGNPLNKYPETRLRVYEFRKET